MNDSRVAEGEFGYFDGETGEYVITRPDTPRPWYNYLINETTVGMISNTSGGVCYDKDPTTHRLLRYRYQNIPYDRPGRYIYVRDNDSKKYWSACWAPVHTDVKKSRYTCRVGFGYNTITFEYDGIKTEVTYFVPQDRAMELWDLKITNTGMKSRNLSTFSYAEFAFWGAMRDLMNIDNGPNLSRQHYKNGAIIHHSYNDLGTGLHDMHFVQVYGFHTASPKAQGYNGDRDLFLGKYRDEKNPVVVETGKSTNYCENGGYPIGCFEHKFTLKPGATKRIVYQTGVAKNERDVFVTSKKYKNFKNVDRAFKETKKYWTDRISAFKVTTPDKEFNTLVNGFVQYQASMTLRLSRSISSYEWGIMRAGFGFRDSCQDQLGMLHAFPEKSKTVIGHLLNAVYPDGGAAHSLHPAKNKYDVGGFYDDNNWLVMAVSQYIKETGDKGFLKTKAGYIGSAKKDSVLEHLVKLNDFTWGKRGKHGLIQTGSADWNDSLNPQDKKTESCFTSALYCASTKELIELLLLAGKERLAGKLGKRCESIARLMNSFGWDGGWYKRLIFPNGTELGAKKNKTLPSIFLEPQPWAVISGLAEGKRAEKALDSTEKLLGTEYGHRLLDRGFKTFDLKIGSAGICTPGIKENASVFNHASSWMIVAEAILGRGDKAMEYFKRMCGATKNRIAAKHEVEPYVACQFISQKPFHIIGRGRNGWLTGTSSWIAAGTMQYIAGCRPEFDGLRIDPCIPKEWNGLTVERTFRGVKYIIEVKNPEHINKGVRYLLVNGMEVPGNLIPFKKSKTPVYVIAVMGK